MINHLHIVLSISNNKLFEIWSHREKNENQSSLDLYDAYEPNFVELDLLVVFIHSHLVVYNVSKI